MTDEKLKEAQSLQGAINRYKKALNEFTVELYNIRCLDDADFQAFLEDRAREVIKDILQERLDEFLLKFKDL